jgi:hypothetical protein
MLRAFHATAIKYVINKLRWEQCNNGYIPGASAWEFHNTMIHKLEDELKSVECAQEGLDKFPLCYYPIAETVKHGPVTLDVVVAREMKDATRDKMIDKELEKAYPFFRQLNIGPRTKYQDKAHAELRDILMSGGYYPDDLEELLPTENLRRYLAGEPFDDRKPSPRPAPVQAIAPIPKPRRLTYDEARVEKENAKIAQQLKDKGIEMPIPEVPKKIGPITKEDFLAQLPKYGPKTKAEVMLPIQREQRQVILTWLRQPWGEYDEEAAALIHKMGNLAFARLEEKGAKEKTISGGNAVDNKSGAAPKQESPKMKAVKSIKPDGKAEQAGNAEKKEGKTTQNQVKVKKGGERDQKEEIVGGQIAKVDGKKRQVTKDGNGQISREAARQTKEEVKKVAEVMVEAEEITTSKGGEIAGSEKEKEGDEDTVVDVVEVMIQ